jgi:SAM-dependent methyltransferase
MTIYCILFGVRNLSRAEVQGKRVLEVGAFDVNGSLRPVLEQLGPAEYIGVDIQEGRGVDRVCDVTELIRTFGEESFDVVICTELLEHVRDWRLAIHNIKAVCRKGGVILVTTRSCGFEYHGLPEDCWRYDDADMTEIFSDCDIQRIERDPEWGICVKAIKPGRFAEKDLSHVELYSVVTGKRVRELRDSNFKSLHFKILMCKKAIRFFLCRRIGDRLIPR